MKLSSSVSITLLSLSLAACGGTTNSQPAPPPPTTLSCSITSPASGTTVSGALSVSISISAAVTSVQLQVDGNNVSSAIAVTGSPVAITFETQSLANGTHALTAVASNATGQMITSAPVSINVSNSLVDIYGGLTSTSCSNGTGGTGWTIDLIGNRYWFCDPLGHRFIMSGVVLASTGKVGSSYAAVVLAKYGGAVATPAYDAVQIQRFMGWNFNSLGGQSDGNALPTVQSSYKLSFWQQSPDPSLWAGVDLYDYAPSATKDVIYGTNPNWNGFDSFRSNLPDVFDPSYATWWSTFAASGQLSTNLNSPFCIGYGWDDSDFVHGIGAGPDFAAIPSSQSNTINVAFTVALTSPVLTLNASGNGKGTYDGKAVLYNDPKTYSKIAMASPPTTCMVATPCSLRDYLYKKYDGNISSLNAAWGNTGATAYTTFDSSGTAVAGESLGNGNGSTVTFSKTLVTGTYTSPYSIAVFVNGTVVAGDCPWFTTAQGCGSTASTGILESPQNAWNASATFYKSWEIVDSLGSGGGSGYLQQVTAIAIGTSCSTGSSAPTWNTTVRGTTADGGCTWTNKGPAVASTSTINYGTRTVSVTFNVPPAPGTTITVSYSADAWMYGTGLMDEDGRNATVFGASPPNGVCLIASSSSYTPCTGSHAPTMQAQAGADLDAWVEQFAGQYFGTVSTSIHANYPATLSFGPSTLGTGSVPPHIGWLLAANQYLSAVNIASRVVPPAVNSTEGAAINNFFINNLTIPIIENNGNQGSVADSPLYPWIPTIASTSIGLTDQESRGQFYFNDWNYKLTTPNSSGKYLFIGFSWFSGIDFWSAAETDNIGFIDSLDNPYDGVNSCLGSHTETIGGTNYTDGGETSFSGNILPAWQPTTAYRAPTDFSGAGGNEIMVNVSGTLYMFQPTTGTSGSSEPTWCTTLNCTVNDGSVTWTNLGSKTSATCWGNMLGRVAAANLLWQQVATSQ